MRIGSVASRRNPTTLSHKSFLDWWTPVRVKPYRVVHVPLTIRATTCGTPIAILTEAPRNHIASLILLLQANPGHRAARVPMVPHLAICTKQIVTCCVSARSILWLLTTRWRTRCALALQVSNVSVCVQSLLACASCTAWLLMLSCASLQSAMPKTSSSPAARAYSRSTKASQKSSGRSPASCLNASAYSSCRGGASPMLS